MVRPSRIRWPITSDAPTISPSGKRGGSLVRHAESAAGNPRNAASNSRLVKLRWLIPLGSMFFSFRAGAAKDAYNLFATKGGLANRHANEAESRRACFGQFFLHC